MARIVTVTVSDAHQGDADTSGPAIAEALKKAGHDVVRHERVANDRAAIAELIETVADADVVFLTGGTGLGPKDVTVEAVEALVEKRLDGFGEAFRRASVDQIGPRGLLSRATAGVLRGCIIVAVPGSTKGATLGAEIAAPILDHASDVARGKAKKH
jgi:molybdenum cofactor biosynthesis protein B